jgi:hypothetical protein
VKELQKDSKIFPLTPQRNREVDGEHADQQLTRAGQ